MRTPPISMKITCGMHFEVLNTKIKVGNRENLPFRRYVLLKVTPENTYLRESWGMEWEPGVVGRGKRGGKREGSGRGKGRVGDAFSIAENAKNCIPPAFICVTLQ